MAADEEGGEESQQALRALVERRKTEGRSSIRMKVYWSSDFSRGGSLGGRLTVYGDIAEVVKHGQPTRYRRIPRPNGLEDDDQPPIRARDE